MRLGISKFLRVQFVASMVAILKVFSVHIHLLVPIGILLRLCLIHERLTNVARHGVMLTFDHIEDALIGVGYKLSGSVSQWYRFVGCIIEQIVESENSALC